MQPSATDSHPQIMKPGVGRRCILTEQLTQTVLNALAEGA